MRKFLNITVASLALLICCAGQSQANLIVNGSFEADPFTGNGQYQLGLVGNAVTGWYIPSGDGIYPWGLQNGAFGASTPFGNQWVVLGRYGTPNQFTIQQTLNGLVVNSTYQLSFAIASELGNAGSIAGVSFLSGSSTASQNFTAPASGAYWTNWATHSMNFVATNSSVTIQFQNINPNFSNGYDLGLDNVSVVGASHPVPEPSSLALLGLGGIGLAVGAYRRQRAATV